MRVLAFITTKRKPEVFQHCVDFVLKTCPDCDFLVLNNGGDPRPFQADFFKIPRVLLMNIPVNVGHPGGVNFGIHHAAVRGYDFFLKLDDDVKILTSDWYNKCAELMAHDRQIGVIGAKILNPDEQTIQWAYTLLRPTGWDFHRGDPRHKEELNRILRVNSVQSSFFFARVEHMRNVGLFDILFSPSQYEDADYCWRMWLKGYSCVYDGRIEVVHYFFATRDDPMRQIFSQVHCYALDLKFNGIPRFGLKLEEDIDKAGREILLPQPAK